MNVGLKDATNKIDVKAELGFNKTNLRESQQLQFSVFHSKYPK